MSRSTSNAMPNNSSNTGVVGSSGDKASFPSSPSSLHINSFFVKDLRSILAKFEELEWIKPKQQPSTSGNTKAAVFEVVEKNEVFAVVSDALSPSLTFILIENDVQRVNAPVYVFVDNLDKFTSDFQARCKGEWDLSLAKFVSSSNLRLSNIIIDQLDLCFVDGSLKQDCGSVTNLVAEWVLSRVMTVSEKEKEVKPPIRREDVIAAALSWHEKKESSKSSNNNSSSSSNSSNSSSSSSSSSSGIVGVSGKTKTPKKKATLAESSDSTAAIPPPASSSKKPSSSASGSAVGKINGFEVVPAMIDFKKYYGRRIDNVFLSLLHKGNYYPVTANSPAPIPFSTEYFEGRFLLMLNTMHFSLRDGSSSNLPNYGPDLYAPRFEGTKYTFDVQVQGRFLKPPPGHLFFGAEISKKMELGLLTRTSCNGLLSIAKNINPFVHYSFGESDNSELPHIAAPLWSTLDKLVITPSENLRKSGIYKDFTLSDTVPDIGGIFEETTEARTKRRKDLQFRMQTDPETIFNMSFKSSQLEWVQWKLANIPLLGKMDLHTFWSDADIKLCMYSAPYGTEADNVGTMGGAYLPSRHLQRNLNHLFSVSIQHKSNHPEYVSQGKVAEGLDYIPQLQMKETKEEENKYENENEEDVVEDPDVNLETRTRRASLSLIGRVVADSSDEGESNSNSDNDNDDDRASNSSKRQEVEHSDSESEDYGGSGGGTNSSSRSNSNSNSTSSRTKSNTVKDRSWSDLGVGSDKDKQQQQQQRQQHLLSSQASDRQQQSDFSNTSSTSNNPYKSDKSESRDSVPFANVSRNISTEKFDESPEMLASYMPVPLVLAAIEIDDRRSSRRYGRRFVYAFLENPVQRMKADSRSASKENNGSGLPSISSSSPSSCCLRTYKEFTAIFSVKKGSLGPSYIGSGSSDGYYYGLSGAKPCNLSRLSESEVRLNELNAAYRDILRQSSYNSAAGGKIREKLYQFLHSGGHTNSFLKVEQCNWIMKSSLRCGLAEFSMESLVLTKLSNTYWSEEVMGLTVDNNLAFIKTTGKVSKEQRSVIHISGILDVCAVDSFDHGFQVADSVMMKITTFSRQILVMMRGGLGIRDKWIGLLQHKMNEWSISLNALNTKSVFNGNSNIKGDLGKIALINHSNRNSQRRHHVDLLIKPKSWNLGDKEILNGRSFTVGASQLIDPNNRLAKYLSTPVVLVEKLLQLVLQLCEAAKSNKYCNGLIDNISGPSTPLSTDFLLRNGGGNSAFTSPVNPASSISASSNTALHQATPITPAVAGKNSVFNTPATATALATGGGGIFDVADLESGSALDVSVMSENIMGLWIEFMDGVALLQAIDLDSKEFAAAASDDLNRSSVERGGGGGGAIGNRYDFDNTVEKEDNTKLAFFINLYHLLLLHSFLILGLPQGTSDFITIFTKIAYEVSGDVMSLSDLEHCVLRNGMARPNVNFIAQSLIPSHKYSYSLTCKRDFRLMWAMNCGSWANWPYITIYRGATLSEQLDANLEHCLENHLRINVESGTIDLPQIVQWYLKDFEVGVDGQPNAKSVLASLSAYTNRDPELQKSVNSLLIRSNNGKAVRITYKDFIYKCRFLEGYNGSGYGYPHC